MLHLRLSKHFLLQNNLIPRVIYTDAVLSLQNYHCSWISDTISAAGKENKKRNELNIHAAVADDDVLKSKARVKIVSVGIAISYAKWALRRQPVQ